MKKNLIIACLALFAFAGFGYTAMSKVLVNVLQADSGREILHPGAAMKSYKNFASTTEAVVCTGRCALFDVIQASGADGAYAILRDSATADGSGLPIVSKMEFDGTGHGALAIGNSNAFPIVTNLGITVDLSSTAGGEEVLIVYKDLD